MELVTDPARLGPAGRFRLRYRSSGLELGGIACDHTARAPEVISVSSEGGGGSAWWIVPGPTLLARLPDGPQTARLSVEATLHEAPHFDPDALEKLRGRQRDEAMERLARVGSRVLHSFNGTVNAAWQLLPADTPSVATATDDDPARRQAVQKAVRVVGLLAQDESRRVELEADCPPVPLAYDVFLRGPHWEWNIGPVVFRPDVRTEVSLTQPLYWMNGKDPVDVVLRPSAHAASLTTDVLSMWEGELKYPGLIFRSSSRVEREDYLRITDPRITPPPTPAAAAAPPAPAVRRAAVRGRTTQPSAGANRPGR
jgi:hypothetical protein